MRASLLWLVLPVSIVLSGDACKRADMASPAQCEKLFDQYIDLELSEDPRARAMSSLDRASLRARIASDALSDGGVRQAKARCEAEVTEAQYHCALAARTSKDWQRCLR